MKQKTIPWFGFTEVPPIGLRIRYLKQFVTLVETLPHVRSDGAETTLLVWRADDGRLGTSGLRGNSVSWRLVDAMRDHLKAKGLA